MAHSRSLAMNLLCIPCSSQLCVSILFALPPALPPSQPLRLNLQKDDPFMSSECSSFSNNTILLGFQEPAVSIQFLLASVAYSTARGLAPPSGCRDNKSVTCSQVSHLQSIVSSCTIEKKRLILFEICPFHCPSRTDYYRLALLSQQKDPLLS